MPKGLIIEEMSRVSASWHVRIFELRETKRGMLGGKKRVSRGFAWSASGDPEGYLFSSETFPSIEEAESNARLLVADEGGTVNSVSAPALREGP